MGNLGKKYFLFFFAIIIIFLIEEENNELFLGFWTMTKFESSCVDSDIVI